MANTNILDYSSVTSPILVRLSSTFTGTTLDGSNTILNTYSNINQLNGDYINDVIDVSGKSFRVFKTAEREGFIDDPIFYFGFLVLTPSPLPPFATPPVVDIPAIIEEPIINSQTNSGTQTSSGSTWTYIEETNLDNFIWQFDLEQQERFNNIEINPICYQAL